MNNSIRNIPPNYEDLGEIDRKIITFLQKNGRESFAKIGEEIGVPASTVRDRTKRLVDQDILHIVGVLNPLAGGNRVMANMGIKLASGDLQEIAQELSLLEEVSFLVICAGSFDLMAEVICRDNAHLLEITSAIRNVPGVFSTETFIYYTIVKEIFDLGTL